MHNQHSAHSAPIPSQKSRLYRRHSAEERRRWVGMYERSGQTLKAFCIENGLALSTLTLWLRQVRGPATRRRSLGAMIEVAMPHPSASIPLGVRGRLETAVTIHLSSNLRVEVAANTDVTWLGELLTLLRKPEHAV